MNDETRLEIDDAETPVNPYSLLSAVNAASARANTTWLIFLGVTAYLLVTVASVTHRDLLLNSDVPVLGAHVPLTRFFLFAPMAVVMVHLGVLGQLALLARKTHEFSTALSMLETTDLRTHPLRLALDNFFFVQVMAGPERNRLVSIFLTGTYWLTLVLLPIALLLLIQLVFLPYHDAGTTLVHRAALLADVAVLVLLGVLLVQPEVSFFRALVGAGLYNPGSLAAGIAILAAAAMFSLFVATIPDAAERERRAGRFTAADGSLFGIFPRNLDLADADLVVGRGGAPGASSINLRGRDLRLARLDRADLRQADLTGANLDGASLVGADLRGARLQCADRNPQLLAGNRGAAGCASARDANFAKALLAEAMLQGADVRGARFEDARLEGSQFARALMAGADLSRAQLQGADLSGGTTLQGASFASANLQGADLAGAKLQMVDMSEARMQGVNLSSANLEGAVLRDADLEGASLQTAKLFGADMRGTKLGLADLSRAMIWRTSPPTADSAPLVDLANIVMAPPSQEEIGQTTSAVAALDSGPLKVRLSSLMAPLHDAGSGEAWAASPEGQVWTSLARTSEATTADGYRSRLTAELVRLACRARSAGGAVATGVARRAIGPGFKGDVALLHERLKAPECAGSAAIPPPILRELAAAAEAVRGQ
jgi:uncharacterized protein YjbI with pentapeptide repeats